MKKIKMTAKTKTWRPGMPLALGLGVRLHSLEQQGFECSREVAMERARIREFLGIK